MIEDGAMAGEGLTFWKHLPTFL
jgi:hypothetical protein